MKKNSHEQNYHTLTRIIILAVILLAIGQVVLYRNIQSVKTMISVTTMELKEGTGVKIDSTTQDSDKNTEVKNVMDAGKR